MGINNKCRSMESLDDGQTVGAVDNKRHEAVVLELAWPVRASDTNTADICILFCLWLPLFNLLEICLKKSTGIFEPSTLNL